MRMAATTSVRTTDESKKHLREKSRARPQGETQRPGMGGDYEETIVARIPVAARRNAPNPIVKRPRQGRPAPVRAVGMLSVARLTARRHLGHEATKTRRHHEEEEGLLRASFVTSRLRGCFSF